MAQEMTSQIEEQIRTRAYYLWEADGCPQGRDWEYWMRAKTELERQPEAPAVQATAPTRKKTAASETRASAPAAKRRSNSRAAVYA